MEEIGLIILDILYPDVSVVTNPDPSCFIRKPKEFDMAIYSRETLVFGFAYTMVYDNKAYTNIMFDIDHDACKALARYLPVKGTIEQRMSILKSWFKKRCDIDIDIGYV